MNSKAQNAITIECAEDGGWLVRALTNGVPGRILLASHDPAMVADYACSVTGIRFDIDDAAGPGATAPTLPASHGSDCH